MSNNDLKRVGLIFTQEGAVDFRKTLQDINIEMNKNYNQFKLTQSQWDNSTKTTEKLRQEQEYLKNAYEIQTDKVNTLKMQLSDLENAENKNTTAIKKKQNELTNAEIKLETYKKRIKEIDSQLKNTGKSIEEFGTKVQNSGKKIEEAGKKMSAFSVATGTAMIASAKTAIDFEDAFTGVEKTVDGTAEQMAELKQGIRDMAKEIPSTTTEISAVAEAAGQLGIKTEDILSFTRVMIDLGNSTNLSAEEAASALAKFANVTKMSAKDYDKLGSTIVALGNNFATTEKDIVEMATRLAATGELAGLSQSQILSLATAMSSVGIEAEAGGSAMSKLLKKIQLATELGGDDLKQFAKVAGMSVSDFKKAYEQDAVKALSAFIGGLNDTKRNGKSAIAILNDMGLTEVRLSNTILSLANASNVMNDAVDLGNKAWEDNTALTNEANKRYDTLKSKLTIAVNKLKDMAITIGNKLMPHIEKIIDKFGKWVEKFDSLSDSQVDMIVNIGLIVAAIGPLVTMLGKITSTVGGVIKGVGTFVQAIGVASGKITSTSDAVNKLAKVFSGLTSPIGLATISITALATAVVVQMKKAEEQTRSTFSAMAEGANNYYNGIQNAESYLSSFNSTLFATAEEQQKLQENMNEVQAGITAICKKASDERRDYTQEEIKQLDEYFNKLRELKDRELEIQMQISSAITQQAKTNSENFKGSLEEYEVLSQKWIKTAQEQADAMINIIEQSAIEETALLNQKYATEEARQSEAYQTELKNINDRKQQKIDLAQAEVAEVTSIYSKEYTQKLQNDTDYLSNTKELNQKLIEEKQKLKNELSAISTDLLKTEEQKRAAAQDALLKYQLKTGDIWKSYGKNMSEAEAEQLGIWLAMQANTELKGGEISAETRELVHTLIESYDTLPKGTREAMKNAMLPMLEEMKKNEPSLYAKASGIANGILSRLKKSFDIHSPSRKTREIFKNVVKRNGKRNGSGRRQFIQKNRRCFKQCFRFFRWNECKY